MQKFLLMCNTTLEELKKMKGNKCVRCSLKVRKRKQINAPQWCPIGKHFVISPIHCYSLREDFKKSCISISSSNVLAWDKSWPSLGWCKPNLQAYSLNLKKCLWFCLCPSWSNSYTFPSRWFKRASRQCMSVYVVTRNMSQAFRANWGCRTCVKDCCW